MNDASLLDFFDSTTFFLLGIVGLAERVVFQEKDNHNYLVGQCVWILEGSYMKNLGNLLALVATAKAALLVRIQRRPSISLFPSLFNDTVIL